MIEPTEIITLHNELLTAIDNIIMNHQSIQLGDRRQDIRVSLIYTAYINNLIDAYNSYSEAL